MKVHVLASWMDRTLSFTPVISAMDAPPLLREPWAVGGPVMPLRTVSASGSPFPLPRASGEGRFISQILEVRMNNK